MRIAGVILLMLGFLLCLTVFGAFFGVPMMIIGVVLIAVGGRKTVITNVVSVQTAPASSAEFGMQRAQPTYMQTEVKRTPVLQPPHLEAIPSPSSRYDRAKWLTLVKYDEEIKSAADRVRPFGDHYEDELAEAYLSVSDKSYLEPIVRKIIQDAQDRP